MNRNSRENASPQNGFEAWGGYMQAKIAKLEEQFSARSNREDEQVSNIFNGVSIYVNGYTKPSADELKALMSKHGGIYHTYQRSDDYIVASNLPDTKVKKQSLVRVVKPEWITDSIEANRLLDYKDYLLYNNFRTQPKLNFVKALKSEPENSFNDTIITKSIVATDKKEVIKDIVGIGTNKKIVCNLPESSNITKLESLTRTAAYPNFIADFYNNSRLHHISQLGACFKQYINELRDTNDFQFPARLLLRENILQFYNNNQSKLIFEGDKIIMHIDMDCFFVSVGLRTRPELRGKPIAVTHARTGQQKTTKRPGVDRTTEFNLYRQRNAQAISKATGTINEEHIFDKHIETKVDNLTDEDGKYGSMSEIASCSYEARAKGISNGMFMGSALRLCPDIIAIPYDFEGYKEVAYTLYNTIAQYTLDIEAVSCDEMYVDCTNIIKSLNVDVQNFASALRDEIKRKTGCPCSTGFGGNRLQARLATKRAKPDGQYFLTADTVEDYMMEIKLRDLPGVGRQTSQRLEALGHQTCGSLQTMPLNVLQRHLGNKTGVQLFDQCRGRDSNPLNFHSVRKSVSAEVNYGIRFENNEQCTQFLTQLSAEVHRRMEEFKVTGRCITLKLMVRAEEAPVETAKFMGHGFCNVVNKSVTLLSPTNDLVVITREVLSICKKLNVDPKEMRGIGIQMSKLEIISNKNVTGALSKFLSAKGQKTNAIKNIENVNNISSKTLTSVDQKEFGIPKKSITKTNTTPKKSISTSPSKKKSPILTSKSPMRKRRKILATSSVSSTSKTLMTKFLQGNSSQSSSNVQANKICIKEEDKSTSTRLINETKGTVNSGILNLPWETVHDMLRAWVNEKCPPLQYDILLLSTYMTDMVVKKKIDKVRILMRFLRRTTKELGTSDWCDVYDQIENAIQNVMLAVYGKRLLI